METEDKLELKVSRRFEATAERVFDAFLDPDLASRFMFATPDGEMVRADIDARVGGKYNFTDRRDGQDAVHTGEYLEIERPRRLAFTFVVDGSESDLVSVDVRPGAGGCEVTITHYMDRRWAEYEEQTRRGWGEILEGLGTTLGRAGA